MSAPIKPKIIIKNQSTHTLHGFLKDYFDLVVYDEQSHYSDSDLALVDHNLGGDWWKNCYNQGLKVIIDNLSEPYDWYLKFIGNLNPDQHYVITNPNWFWYVESEHIALTRSYTINKTYKKLVLMPLNSERSHRIRLFDAMQPYLQDCVYSFAQRGIYLPNDCTRSTPAWDRHFNCDWYNDTYFSLVSETWTDDTREVTKWGGPPEYRGPWPFVTEKTMKPMAYQHPFLIYGQSNTLKYLHNLGFESYENLFDESYDQIDNSQSGPDLKLKAIIDNVKNFKRQEYDSITLEKIQHNYALYTNQSLIRQRVYLEIIEPLLNYAET